MRPEFRIGTIESLSKCFLPSFVTRVRENASRIFAVTGTSQSLIRALQRKEIDFALVSDLFSEKQGLTRLKVFEEQSVLLMPSSVLPSQGKEWTWGNRSFVRIAVSEVFSGRGCGSIK